MSQDATTLPFEPAKTEPLKQPKHAFVGHAKLIGSITFLSRILGMAREAVAANFFGAGVIYSAFTFAFTIPNLFRKLLGEGALSAAFIPLYAQAVKQEQKSGLGFRVSGIGKDSADPNSSHPIPETRNPKPDSHLSSNDFAAASVNLLCLICLGLTFVGELLLLLLVVFIHMPADYLLGAKLTMIMLPYVLLVCGTAFLGSILQVHQRFTAITFTAVVSNACLIVAMVAAAKTFDLHTEAGQLATVKWLSISVLIAGALQIAMLLPSLRAIGFRFHPSFHVWTPQVRKMILLTLPVALSAGVMQVSVLLDKGIAFFLSQGPDRTVFHLLGHTIRYPMLEGATQRLNWAQYMYQFPLGVFAIALATAIFPKLSTDAMDEGRHQFKSVLRHGVEASMFIALPASVGMIVVRYPAVRLLFQRGSFTSQDAELVAFSTAIYSAAIWAFSLQQILNRAYYALHDTKTPLIWAIVNIIINTGIELPLLWTMGEAGMAVGTLVSFAIQAVIMLAMLDRRVGGLEMKKSMPAILKMIAASLAMWLACIGVQHVPGFPNGSGKWIWALQLFAIMGTGAGVYFGACAAMGISVLEHVIPRKKRRGNAE